MVPRFISVVSIRSLTSLLLSPLAHRVSNLLSRSRFPTLAKTHDARGKIRRWARRNTLRSGGYGAISDWPTILPCARQSTTAKRHYRSSCSTRHFSPPAGHARRTWLTAALYALDHDLRDAGGSGLTVLRGDPVAVVPRLANAHDVESVFISADFGPYGRSRDERVAKALGAHNIELS